MKKLENRLFWLKANLNSYYGSTNNFDLSKLYSIYDETFTLKSKIKRIKNRKSKIKSILNG